MSLFSSLRESPAPSAAVEIAANRVSAASLEWRGTQPVVAAHAAEPLADGVLTPQQSRLAFVASASGQIEIVDRCDHLGGHGMAFGRHPQQYLQQLDDGRTV